MRKTVAVCLLLLFFSALPTAAETTRFWRQSKFDEFDKGRAEGLALRSDGLILLAPRFRQLADPGATYLWTIALDSKGNIYAGGGSGARVFKIDPQGKSSVFFESKEMEVHALAFDSSDDLYVATSPDGKVYRVHPDGKSEVFFEPKTKYIWDLAITPSGDLYIATGDQGRIFRINKEGQGGVFVKVDETHVRSLTLDAKGNLIAGTDPNGLVMRISPAGEAFVLYETPKKEVTALAIDPKGNIYAAAIGERIRPPAVPTQPAVQPMVVAATAPQAGVVTVPGGVPQQQVPFLPFPTVVGGSEVYRIAPDGYPKRIWISRDELVYGLDFDPSGQLILATGNRGRIIQVIDDENLFTNLVKSTSAQVTGLIRTPSGRIYACTANPGKVYELGPGYEPEGSFESQVFDAKLFSEWGRIHWESRGNSAAGTIKFYTRTGNTSQPEKNWSPWSRAYTDPQGERVESPSARFVQWKTVMTSSGKDSVTVNNVEVAYLSRNVAPVIDAVVVQAPGVRVQGVGAAPAQPQQLPVQLSLPQAQIPGQPTPPQPPQPPPHFEVPPQGMSAKGYQSVLWSAHDDNDDELQFAVYYRAEGEKNWKLMKDKLKEKFYTWDAATLPDGAYYIKVTATDAPSNPPDQALTAEKESERFEVDNTAPRIDNLAAQRSAPGQMVVRFQARDTFSEIQKADYSVDAGDWIPLNPVTRTTDSLDERYEWTLKSLGKGEHTIVVRVYDKFDNVALGRLTINVD